MFIHIRFKNLSLTWVIIFKGWKTFAFYKYSSLIKTGYLQET